MLTDAQRRWWFATHPEYSRHSERLEPSDHFFLGRRDRRAREAECRMRGVKEADEAGLPEPHTAFDLLPYRRFLTAPIAALKGLVRNQATGYVLNAVKKGKSKGPGEWVEVCRSRTGLEHQSKMSGQPIRRSGGKHYINEYEVNGVKFDDYKRGTLYEYKGPYGNLLNKNGEFDHWFEGASGARQQARSQVEAAKGRRLIWRVGENQVKAFEKALRGVDGVIIKP